MNVSFRQEGGFLKDAGIADRKVEQHRAANDGHPGYPDVESDFSLLQVLHHPRGGIQAERAPPGQQDRADPSLRIKAYTGRRSRQSPAR
jgi:hypothetical protein